MIAEMPASLDSKKLSDGGLPSFQENWPTLSHDRNLPCQSLDGPISPTLNESRGSSEVNASVLIVE